MKKFGVLTLLSYMIIIGVAGHGRAQNNAPAGKTVNFPYSRNPLTKSKPAGGSQSPAAVDQTENTRGSQEPENTTVAKKTLEIARRASTVAVLPTETYKVGVADILFISLQNGPAKDSTYYTVLNDGRIDYPLAGEMVYVQGMTTDEIEEALSGKIKIYKNPQVAVKVREYASHSITVLGMVEKAGEKFLQREAVPLFVIKAEAVVQPDADQVTIRRADARIETHDLKDIKTEEILIMPGDFVEFGSTRQMSAASGEPEFFYIGGEVASVGKKDFHPGLTLTQAILASGGLRRSNAKKVVIRRKNAEGLLVSSEYNLKEIKSGKAPDPALAAGDTIEIEN